jgi:hypothetical protein
MLEKQQQFAHLSRILIQKEKLWMRKMLCYLQILLLKLHLIELKMLN